jgi:hypothetical protein
MKPPLDPHYRHRFPVEVISHAMWLYHVFSLSLRNVELLVAERGIIDATFLYADTASHRPRYFGVPGSGWEQFPQFGNMALRSKIMIGLSFEAFGLTTETPVEGYAALPLRDRVIGKWLYGNAQCFFRLG